MQAQNKLGLDSWPLPRVLVIAPSPPPYGGMALQARLLEKLLRSDGKEVEFFPANFSCPGWLGRFGRLPGIRTALRATLIWFKLCGPVRRADVIHIFAASWLYFYMVVYPAVLLGRAFGRRVVVNYRGGEAARFFRWNRWQITPVFHLADVITAPSDFLATVITSCFGTPVYIVPNILDLSAFRYRKRENFAPALLATRHLEKIYDIESVLRAFREVQFRYPEASLWIVGTGSQAQRLRSLASEWKLNHVRFLGHVAHSDLPAICDRRDILLNASLVDNFPGALLEASAAGLAVVSTGAGGIPYIYQNGNNALLVEPGDWRGLAEATLRILDDQSLGRDLTIAAEVMARQCDWRKVRSRLYAAYGCLAEDGKEQVIRCGAG